MIEKIIARGKELRTLQGHDRLQYLVDLARDVQPLSNKEKTDENKIRGCASNLWVVGEKDKNIDQTEVKSSFYSGINNDNIILNWTTILGYKYQIQSSEDLINWYDISEEIIGTGSNLTWGNYIFEDQKYYRVIEKFN